MMTMAEADSSLRGQADFKRELVELMPQLRAFARGLTGRPDYADDLVQEAVIKAWAARDRFQPGTNMRAWTFTILRNHYIGELRRAKRQADYDEGAAERLLVQQGDQEDRIHLSDLDDALQEMVPERREALVLVGAGGFSYQEAADIAGCALGTMKSRVARARTELAERLEAKPVRHAANPT
jgi:RNA polymerase sigma-70 factor (ECF subfamily)